MLNEPFFWLIAEILLPMIPAALLFWRLPSTGMAHGNILRGLEVKFGGAFAGYFAVFLVLIFYVPPPPKSFPQWQAWQLSGDVRFAGPSDPIPPSAASIAVIPPESTIFSNGHFEVNIAVTPGPMGKLKLPSLWISSPPLTISGNRTIKYEDETIDLDKSTQTTGRKRYTITRDETNHQITITPTIELSLVPTVLAPYQPPKSNRAPTRTHMMFPVPRHGAQSH